MSEVYVAQPDRHYNRCIGSRCCSHGPSLVVQFTAAAYQQAFFAAFGPCGTFTGYADRPTKALIARIITDGDSMDAVSGASDNQMPGLCAVPGLFAHGYGWSDIEAAVLVVSTHEDALAGARVLFDSLSALADGASLSDALRKGSDGIDHPLKKRLQEAMGMSSYQPLQAAEHFGSACSVVQALPVVWHLLTYAADFESAVRDNIRCGGDNCGRAVALGAIAGLSMGVPEDMLKKLLPASSQISGLSPRQLIPAPPIVHKRYQDPSAASRLP